MRTVLHKHLIRSRTSFVKSAFNWNHTPHAGAPMTVIACTSLFLRYPKLSAIAIYHGSCLQWLKIQTTTSLKLFCLDIVTELGHDHGLTAQMSRNSPLRFTSCWSTKFNTYFFKSSNGNWKSAVSYFIVYSHLFLLLHESCNSQGKGFPKCSIHLKPSWRPSNTQSHRTDHKYQAAWCKIQISQLNISLKNYFLQVFEISNWKFAFSNIHER